MAKPAYVILNADGTIARTHTTDIGTAGAGTPTTGSTDLEQLINLGYVSKREHPLEGGKMLIVLDRP